MLLLRSLHMEQMLDLAREIEKWLDALLNFTAGIASRLADAQQADTTLYRCVIVCQLLIREHRENIQEESRRIDQAKNLINGIRDTELKKRAQTDLDEVVSELSQEPTADEINWKDMEKHYERQAEALGIDLRLADLNIDDPNDSRYAAAFAARIVSLGIRDLNPTRILRNCERLAYEFDNSAGIPARMLHRPSARMKILGCLLHLEHGTIGGYSLDEIYSDFRERYCKVCADVKPRSSDWTFTFEWHREQIEQFKKRRNSGTSGQIR